MQDYSKTKVQKKFTLIFGLSNLLAHISLAALIYIKKGSWINRLLNLGVSSLNENGLNRKIRISNLISLITIGYMLVFLPTAIRFNYYSISIFNLIYLITSILSLCLNAYKKHTLSFYTYCCTGVIYFSHGTLLYGLQSHMHLFLVTICMITIVLLDNFFPFKILSGIICVIFLILVIYMRNRPGFAIFSDEMKKVRGLIEMVNLFSVFFITVAIFLFFKRDNYRYHSAVIEQKRLVQQKQKDILDSLTYAKRIQEALLPSPQNWHKIFPESFIIYKPKNIVAGDFYWMGNDLHSNTILFAVADCTGHGVPGAMVSVVCHNALNRSLFEFKLTDPGKMLGKTRDLVIETFSKSDNEVKDGMDISLCRLNLETNELQWSGANNPLWIIQNNELKEIKADKQPIGNHELQKPFTTHLINLKKGDLFYLFTDGYADQFGGPKGKKFKSKKLQESFLAYSTMPVNTQKEKLEALFTDWKSKLEQVDDVCILGIRL